jgi:hypothetical protein
MNTASGVSQISLTGLTPTPIELAMKIDQQVAKCDHILYVLQKLPGLMDELIIPLPPADDLIELYKKIHEILNEYIKSTHPELYQQSLQMLRDFQDK